MIVIVDNGKGADDIARFVRGSKVVKPAKIPKDADAYILSDGEQNKKDQTANVKLIKSSDKPILGIGVGYVYVGLAFGAKTAKASCGKTQKVSVKTRSPILLDLKKQFSVNDGQKLGLGGISDDFGVIASSTKNEIEIIQHGANPENSIDSKPIFGVHFNPEAGLDGLIILKNFEKFIVMWSKYH